MMKQGLKQRCLPGKLSNVKPADAHAAGVPEQMPPAQSLKNRLYWLLFLFVPCLHTVSVYTLNSNAFSCREMSVIDEHRDEMKQMCRNGAFAFFEAILCVGPHFIVRVVPEEVAGVYFLRTKYQHLEVQQWPPSICLRKLHQVACLRHLFALPCLQGFHQVFIKFTWFLTTSERNIGQADPLFPPILAMWPRSACWERTTVFSASPQLHWVHWPFKTSKRDHIVRTCIET